MVGFKERLGKLALRLVTALGFVKELSFIARSYKTHRASGKLAPPALAKGLLLGS